MSGAGTGSSRADGGLDARSPRSRLRTAFIVIGIVAIIVGVLALLLPHATLLAIVWVFGLYLIVSGAVSVIRGIAGGHGSGGSRIALIVLGALMVIAGIVALVRPPIGVSAIGVLVGVGWIFEGITLLYSGGTIGRPLTIVTAILSIIVGVLFIALPLLGAVFVVATVGTILIVFGIVQLIAAAGLRATRA